MKPDLLKYVDKFNNIWKQKCSEYDMLPNILPPVNRIIVIGDIHGDIKVLLDCLKIAKVIHQNVKWCKNNHLIEWIGGDTVIVQVGDQIDSCRYDGLNTCNDPTNYEFDEPHDINILYFMTALHKKAAAKGGAVYSLMGNHELMNVRGDLSYVSHSNIQYFTNLIPNVNISSGIEKRKYVFAPGNTIANFLACTRNIALIIGDNLFVHAGIIPTIINKYKVDDLNMLLKLFLFNELKDVNNFNDIFTSKKSPMWTREFGTQKKNACCDRLMTPLKEIYKVGKIFVGHTPQINTGITSTCNGRIWQTDVGMPAAFNKFDPVHINSNGERKQESRHAQVLEILKNGTITILK